MAYRPLPEYLQIRRSSIDGHGLFTTRDLPPNFEIGITHVKDDKFEDGYIRTPLGGFFNHSDTPNCQAYESGAFIRLKTIKHLVAGDELVVYYWLSSYAGNEFIKENNKN
jgi:hypothetical protein|tara:strand:- start:950 stop:1279 length:330 start_codon:yes stop_codon:yes gene_type:complete